MGEITELPRAVRAFLSIYRWRRNDPVPFFAPRKDRRVWNVGIVSTAGFTLPGQARFDESIRGGDSSYRVIDATSDVSSLTSSHRSESFDRSGIEADPSLAFPLDRMSELAADGTIGRVNHRHLSFMGSITRTSTLVNETAPSAAKLFVEDGVDVALLVPV